MRKLILGLLVILPLAAGACERSSKMLDRIPSGSQVTLTTSGGRAVSGRLSETRADALVIQPAAGAPVTVPRNDIASVTISTVEAKATGQAAASANGASRGTAAPSPSAGLVPTQTAPPASAAGGNAPAEPVAPTGDPTMSTAAAAEKSVEPTRTASAKWRDVTLPAGTVLPIRLDESLASDRSRVEEPVTATVVQNVRVHGVTAVPAGSVVRGTVTEAKQSGRVKGVAQLAVRFDSIAPKGSDERYRMRTGLLARRAGTTHKKDALQIGVPTAGGAILGGLLGGKKGALIGGTVAGGAGTAVVLSTRGKEVRLPRGSQLSIRLLEPVTVRVPA